MSAKKSRKALSYADLCELRSYFQSHDDCDEWVLEAIKSLENLCLKHQEQKKTKQPRISEYFKS